MTTVRTSSPGGPGRARHRWSGSRPGGNPQALARPTPALGTWTYDDLLALPEDGKRYEIIEGELYELPRPNAEHALTIVT
jgi:hypothetical protein